MPTAPEVLLLMNIESEMMRHLNFDDIIEEFACKKSRKVFLWIPVLFALYIDIPEYIFEFLLSFFM